MPGSGAPGWLFPAEYYPLAGALPTINRDAQLPLDWLQEVIRDAQLPLDLGGLTLLSRDAQLPLEFAAGVRVYGGSFASISETPISALPVQRFFATRDAQLPLDWLQSIQRDAQLPLDVLGAAARDAQIPLELLAAATVVRDAQLPVEFLSQVPAVLFLNWLAGGGGAPVWWREYPTPYYARLVPQTPKEHLKDHPQVVRRRRRERKRPHPSVLVIEGHLIIEPPRVAEAVRRLYRRRVARLERLARVPAVQGELDLRESDEEFMIVTDQL